ncbi:uncharacterized protein J7T54_001419 [Emericellopsis cladophorae]|uniref:Protein HRI1 n=1 Tax=Emericellopsis cladophorae TaxID=2686198 RepID=A0A9Q0BD34_9HYPO|nr:uncharacterized protein J7T54_001419 [Emericellopsis cladophorae]KAI6781457.1 hypothetical protein J7T54_001419 [Emericellopsis cladophorae]
MSISLREYIRWLPDDATEPTSTIVVTSPGSHFVDIRALRPASAPTDWPSPSAETVQLTPDQLDWAIAGTSSYERAGNHTRGRWAHWIDSRTTDTDGVADEGDNHTQPDGTTLEKGVMLNPATGKETEYEELWRDVQVLPLSGDKIRSVVVQMDKGNDTRGSVVLAGQYCQGLLRKAGAISVERWQFGQCGWEKVLGMGTGSLPCHQILSASDLSQGQTFDFGGDDWKVVEMSFVSSSDL